MGWINDVARLKWKDLDPTNKNGQLAENLRDLDKQVLQPIVQGELAAAFSGLPFAGPFYTAYFMALAQGSSKSFPLPLWLKMILRDLNYYPGLDLTKVNYHIKSSLVDGAIAVGYNIFFDYEPQLERPNVNTVHLQHILHELQHVLQYQQGGGVGPVFGKIALEYQLEGLAQLGKLTQGAALKNIHDDAPSEAEADRVAEANLQPVLDLMLVIKNVAPPGGSRGGHRPSDPFPLRAPEHLD